MHLLRTFALALGLCLPAAPLLAQVGISPAYYDLSAAEAGKTQTFRLFNYTDQPKKVRVSLAPWDADPANQPRLLPPGPTTLDQWVVVNPVEFEVQPQSSQAVRFSVRPAAELPSGEQRVMFIFDEINEPAEDGKMRARFQFRSALYVQSGQTVRKGDIESINATPEGAKVRLKNAGNANVRLQGQFAIWQADAFPGVATTTLVPALGTPEAKLAKGQVIANSLPGNPVLPGETHDIAFTYGGSPLKPGRYVLDFNGKLGDAQLDRSVEFVVGAAGR
jgi:P pilus assembly chaperone PapD